MKKRILTALLSIAMVLSFAACGGKDTNNNNSSNSDKNPGNSQSATKSTVDVLNNVWNKFPQEEKFFAMGGDNANMQEDKAGKFSTTDTEGLKHTLHISDDAIALVDEAASLIHSMNANTFTAASFSLKDKSKKDDFANSLKESIKGTQWMCGFPETLVIYTVDDYVVYALGNVDLIKTFKTTLEKTYSDAKLVTEEALA